MFSLTWEDTVRVTGIGLQRLKNRRLLNRERIEIAMHLSDVDNSVRWSVADLLVDTEDAIVHGAKGSHYAEVAAKIPYHVAARTLENWASVARRIPYHERYTELSFSHHVELATEDDKALRDKFAQEAIERGYSVRALREVMQAARSRMNSVRRGYAEDYAHDAVIEEHSAVEKVEQLEQENYTLRLMTGETDAINDDGASWRVIELSDDLRVMARVPVGEEPERYVKKRIMEVMNVFVG